MHTWKEAQIVLAFIFAIGSDSAVLPDHNRWRTDGASIDPAATPAKIALRALISALQVQWFLSKTEATIAEINVFHIFLRNTAINANQLYRLKQFVINRGNNPKRDKGIYPPLRSKDITSQHLYYHGVKFHYMTLLACFQRLNGLTGSGKDTECSESFHKKVVKAPLEAISNQTAGRLLECARFIQKQLHAECMMHKRRLTIESELCENGQSESVDSSSSLDDDFLACPVVKMVQSKCFKSQILTCSGHMFYTGDKFFFGHPFLHPRISLSCLNELFHIYHSRLIISSLVVENEHLYLGLALKIHSSPRVLMPIPLPPVLILTEAVKRSSTIRCGDLKSSGGSYFIRSTQSYTDDRRGPIEGRTSHAINSFCFIQGVVDQRIALVRVLGIISMEHTRKDGPNPPTCVPVVYLVVVVMTKVARGYLPFDRYKYSFIDHGPTSSYLDVRIVKADNITSPAFCVPEKADDFRVVDDLQTDHPCYYCISPKRVMSTYYTYDELLMLNTVDVDPTRTILQMNQLNHELEVDVAAFNKTAAEDKLSKADMLARKKQEDRQANGSTEQRKESVVHKRRGHDKRTKGKGGGMESKKKKTKSRKIHPWSDDESDGTNATDDSYNNIFG